MKRRKDNRQNFLLFIFIIFFVSKLMAQQEEWIHIGLSDEQVGSLDVSVQNPNILFVGTYEVNNHTTITGSVYKSTNAGYTWIKVLADKRMDAVAIDPKNSDMIYASVRYGGVYKSINGGNSWTHLTNGIEESCSIASIAVDLINSNTVYLGGSFYADEFWKSTNAGGSWEIKNDGLPDIYGGFRLPHNITFDPNDHDHIYISLKSGIYRSSDAGETWSSQLCSENMLVLRSDPNISGIVYGGTDVNKRLIKSTDFGYSWHQIGPSNFRVFDLAIDKENPDLIYAACMEPGGVWRSIDGGANWSSYGLEKYKIRCVSISTGSTKRIYAGTQEDGIFVLEVTTKVLSRESPSVTMCGKLYQNYPNPFNPSTEIRFTLTKSSQVTIKIYDLLGKEIDKLVNEQREAGEYTVEWVPKDLPSGIYLYRLEAGDFVETKKMIYQL